MIFSSLDPKSAGLSAARLAWLLAGLGIAVERSQAQSPSAPIVGDELSTPVEITMSVINDEVLCRPPLARLPAQDPLDLRVVNRSESPLWFVAPQFFAATEHLESAGFVLDLAQGGFLVAPRSTARVILRTPVPGEYYFSCFAPGRVPNPSSSGFLIVVPAAL